MQHLSPCILVASKILGHSAQTHPLGCESFPKLHMLQSNRLHVPDDYLLRTRSLSKILVCAFSRTSADVMPRALSSVSPKQVTALRCP